jgi:hypothetical protein
MATTYKAFLDDDIVTAKTLLNENIPVTGSVISSSIYGTGSIKSYTHGMFQSVYDYPYLSSSANQLFDMTVGITSDSPAKGGSDAYSSKKINIYNQMAQVLVGYDTTGSILKFDADGNSATSDDKYSSLYFLNFNRLLAKDEIKKGSLQLTLGIGTGSTNPFQYTCSVSDSDGLTNYKTNSPTGEYGILYASGFTGNGASNTNNKVGLVFYQAGIAVLSPAIFAASGTNAPGTSLSSSQIGQLSTAVSASATYNNVEKLFESGSIDDCNLALRNRIQNLTFNNTTELNSTIHFCRINHNDFNYSSNPTYLSGSQIRVKNKTTDAPISYITTVGLYSPDNELLAVAKLSEPIKKDPTQELILRVRLDY